MDSAGINGAIERLQHTFAGILAETPRGGAALSIWQEDKCILSLYGGEAFPGKSWTRQTPCLIWSASKGVAAACTLHALQEKGISLETPVSEIWPEFSKSGKNRITLKALLSHQAGLAAIDQKGLSITDHEGVAAALASQPPNWMPDGSHGYGARTFGFLVDEIVRRVSGKTLASYWNGIFRKILESDMSLDIWFGLPGNRQEEVATVIAPRTPPDPSPFSVAFGTPNSLTRRALSEPGGTLTPSVMNTTAMREASIPSLGVISTADALARFYSFLPSSLNFFTPESRTLMQTSFSRGLDRTLLEKTSFSAGFMTNAFGVYGPSRLAFGHPGAGGAIGFADPENGLGFAFIPSAMNPGALPGVRTKSLLRALYGMTNSE